MREIEQIKNIVDALDIEKQFEKAEKFLKEKEINKPFFDGFYGHKVDIVEQIEKFKRDYSGSPLVVCVLSLEKSKKAYQIVDGAKVEVDPPVAQEKTFIEVSGRNFTNRVTNFYSVKYLQEVAEKTGLKIETFEFGNTIVHLTILYDDMKPVEVIPPVEVPPFIPLVIPPIDPDKGLNNLPPLVSEKTKKETDKNSKKEIK